jgi:hypothetical protein
MACCASSRATLPSMAADATTEAIASPTSPPTTELSGRQGICRIAAVPLALAGLIWIHRRRR